MVLTSLSSCSQKDDPEPDSLGEKSEGNYFPMETGNTWTYEGDINYTNKVLDQTKSVNGRDYTIIQATNGSQVSLTYYDLEKDHLSCSSSPGSAAILTLFKSDAKVGTTWSNTYVSNDILQYKYEFEMLGQVGPRKVSNVTYDDVIAVQMITSYRIRNLAAEEDEEQWFPYSSYTSQTTYYALNVGFIEQTGTQTGLNVKLVSSTLY